MKTALVTGATGFIGVHLTEELIRRGVVVYALCRQDSPCRRRISPQAHILDCGMDEYGELSLRLRGIRPDVFYHLAWEGATGPERSNAFLQQKNSERALQALHAAQALECGKFVATGTVFENLADQILRSKYARFADFYILSKRYARDMCRQSALKLGLSFVWATFFHPIGRYIKPEQMMAYAIGSLLQGKIPTFGPAEQPYDILAVEDVAQGLYRIGECGAANADHYYIGSGAPRPMRAYLEEARRVLDIQTPLGIGKRPDDGMRFDFSWFNCDALRAETGYSPCKTFADAVLITKEYIQTRMASEG